MLCVGTMENEIRLFLNSYQSAPDLSEYEKFIALSAKLVVLCFLLLVIRSLDWSHDLSVKCLSFPRSI